MVMGWIYFKIEGAVHSAPVFQTKPHVTYVCSVAAFLAAK